LHSFLQIEPIVDIPPDNLKKVYCTSSSDGITHRERLRGSFADGASALWNLEDKGWFTLRAVLGVPRADPRKFSAGVALSGGRMVPRRLQAHSRAIIGLVILETPQL